MKINCWDFMNCGRELSGRLINNLGVCSALRYTAFHGDNSGHMGGRVCWKIVGTFSGGNGECARSEKLGDCQLCDFFKLVKEEEGSNFVL